MDMDMDMDNIICDCAFPAILRDTKCCEDCEANPNHGQEENESMNNKYYYFSCNCALPELTGSTECCEYCLNNPNRGQELESFTFTTPNCDTVSVPTSTKKMELFETVDLMKSLDYKERFIAEYVQLKIRHDKLYDIIVKYEANKLTFKPQCSLDLLKKQAGAMREYLYYLRVRALLEDIKLPET